MIFMHKATGEIFELLILSLQESGLVYFSGTTAYSLGKFTLYGSGIPTSASTAEMATQFEFIGVL